MFTINLAPTCHEYITNCVVVYMVRELRLWNGIVHRTLCAHLVSEGFMVGKNDPCVYINPTTKVRLVVVVDDILCRGSRQATEAFFELMRFVLPPKGVPPRDMALAALVLAAMKSEIQG